MRAQALGLPSWHWRLLQTLLRDKTTSGQGPCSQFCLQWIALYYQVHLVIEVVSRQDITSCGNVALMVANYKWDIKKLDPGMKIKIVSCKKIKDWSETKGTLTGSNCIKTSYSSHNLSRTWQSKHKNLHVTKLNPAIWSLRQKDENPGMVSYVTAAKSLLIGLGDRLSVTQKGSLKDSQALTWGTNKIHNKLGECFWMRTRKSS